MTDSYRRESGRETAASLYVDRERERVDVIAVAR